MVLVCEFSGKIVQNRLLRQKIDQNVTLLVENIENRSMRLLMETAGGATEREARKTLDIFYNRETREKAAESLWLLPVCTSNNLPAWSD
jgi:hypothetical protein